MLGIAGTLGAGVVAWAIREERSRTRVEERLNWLCVRYAEDHDEAVPWSEPLTDGGFPVEEEQDGDSLAPHHFYVGVAAAVFGFASVWPYYPVTGAGMAIVGILVAADDLVSHAFGWPTPLDQLWKRAILPIVRKAER